MSRLRYHLPPCVLVAALVMTLTAPVLAQGQLFWSVAGFGDDNPALVRANPDGNQPDVIISTVTVVR